MWLRGGWRGGGSRDDFRLGSGTLKGIDQLRSFCLLGGRFNRRWRCWCWRRWWRREECLALAGECELPRGDRCQFPLSGCLGLSREILVVCRQQQHILEQFDLGLDYLEKYARLIGAITVDDVLAAARDHIHPGRLGVSIAGPYGERA